MIRPYYRDELTTIYHGDCREILSALARPDHILTDPPYAPETHKGARSTKGGKLTHPIDFAPIDVSEIRRLFSLAAPTRWIISFNDFRHAAALDASPPIGYRAIRIGIWVKPNACPQFTGDRPGQGWEAISFLHSTEAKLSWNGGGKRSVYDFNKVNAAVHPTEKPLRLINQLILDFTNKGETILDPFMGSGTTLRAAKDLGRQAIGIELEERHCETAVRRLRQESFAY